MPIFVAELETKSAVTDLIEAPAVDVNGAAKAEKMSLSINKQSVESRVRFGFRR